MQRYGKRGVIVHEYEPFNAEVGLDVLGLVALNADILSPVDGATVPPARPTCAAGRGSASA